VLCEGSIPLVEATGLGGNPEERDTSERAGVGEELWQDEGAELFLRG
jgi:hypothetical protein